MEEKLRKINCRQTDQVNLITNLNDEEIEELKPFLRENKIIEGMYNADVFDAYSFLNNFTFEFTFKSGDKVRITTHAEWEDTGYLNKFTDEFFNDCPFNEDNYMDYTNISIYNKTIIGEKI